MAMNLAFETEIYEGFQLKAFYTDGLDAHIEVTRDGQPFRTGDYPSYRIWNLAAHFRDMVDAALAQEGKEPTI